MNIGEILLFAFLALTFIGVPLWLSFKFGRGGEDDDKFNSKETPDAVFVRGTKGLLIILGVFAFIVLGSAYEAGGSDGSLVFDRRAFKIGLIIFTPVVLSYMAGIFSAYLAAQKRIKLYKG